MYDTETGLYYLQSRYYNPEMGRFINADGLLSTGKDIIGYNMFAYCGNNPVNFIDPGGTSDAAVMNDIWATWTSSMWWLNFSDGPLPIGEIVYFGGIGVLNIIAWFVDAGESTESNYTSSKSASKYDPDPYARPNQKKQNRETKNKNRRKDNFQPKIIGVMGNLPHRSTILLGVIIESSASQERLRWICSISKSGRL